MLITYFKIAWRNLLKNKLHTAINTGGLVIGFTIGLGILLVVYSQYRFDAFHSHGKNIYEVYQSVINKEKGEEITNAMSYAAGPAYGAAAASIEKMTRITDGGNHVQYNGKELLMPVMMADKDFFSMFSFEITAGNHQNPLQNLTDAVLTEEAAHKIFGGADPIGKTIQASAGDQLKTYTIAAVIKTMQLSSIQFELLTRIENRTNYAGSASNWTDHAPSLYVQLKPGFQQAIAEKQLQSIDAAHVPEWFSDPHTMVRTQLLPLNQVHFSSRVSFSSLSVAFFSICCAELSKPTMPLDTRSVKQGRKAGRKSRMATGSVVLPEQESRYMEGMSNNRHQDFIILIII